MGDAMTEMLDRLTSEPSIAVDGDEVYDLAQIRSTANRVIDLGGDAVLAMAIGPVNVGFAVLDLAYTAEIGGVKLSLVFHGEGPSDGLRELRHTYWGEDGYLFYPDARVITAALAALKEWFDVG